ncbi:hypothetical protein [Pontibacter chitinilyticus]
MQEQLNLATKQAILLSVEEESTGKYKRMQHTQIALFILDQDVQQK